MVTRHRIDRLLSIQEIKANPRNARSHSKAQIRQIAESIKAFGSVTPCRWTKRGLDRWTPNVHVACR